MEFANLGFELERNQVKVVELFRRGQILNRQMVNEGSIGTPTYRQIIMQKQTAQEGVQIAGYERS